MTEDRILNHLVITDIIPTVMNGDDSIICGILAAKETYARQKVDSIMTKLLKRIVFT